MVDEYEGVNVDLVREIAKILNFDLDIENIPYAGIRVKPGFHLYLHYAPIFSVKADFFMLPTYASETVQYLVPPGVPYSAYMKLLLAFDFDTWICNAVKFFEFSTILVVSFTSKKVQEIVFGSRVKSPSLNVIVAFFRLGQMMLPRRSFGR